MLTPAAVRAAQPQARAYKLHDQRGLFLFVAPSGLKSWRLKHRRGGGEQLVTLGRYPTMSLPAARSERDAVKQRLKAGLAATAPRTGGASIDTFEQLARAWHAHQAPRWSEVHAGDVLGTLERYAFPELGEMPVAAIDAPALLPVLEGVEGSGRLATAKRLRQRLSSVFRFGIARSLCDADPASILAGGMLPARPPRQHPALLTAEECRQLLADCEGVPARRVVRQASRFLALTAVRLDAVRGMCWGEVENLDGPAPIWRVPAKRMKLAKVKKEDRRFDHLVPLSPQAVRLLREVADHPGEVDELVFRSGAKNAPIGEGAIRQLYLDAGYRNRHVPHGWRASFSTILNESMPEERGEIDRALAHTPKDKVEAAYNRALQIQRRRALFDRWGELMS